MSEHGQLHKLGLYTMEYSVDFRGFWKFAHALNRKMGLELQDAQSELLLEALELIAANPDMIEEKGVGYLLKSAYYGVMNDHRYDRQTVDFAQFRRSESAESADVAEEMKWENILVERGHVHDDKANLFTFIRDSVSKLDEKSQTVCRMLAAGFKKKEIARAIGCSSSMITKHIKKLRLVFGSAIG